MRSIALLFIAITFSSLTTYADAFDDVKVTDLISNEEALKEFETLRNEFNLQKCVKTKCSITKWSETLFIKTSKTTIAGYTVQESYTKTLGPKKTRTCLSEIHASDFTEAAIITFICQTEQK